MDSTLPLFISIYEHRADEPPVCVPACSCTHADRRASHRQATKRIISQRRRERKEEL